MRSNVSSAARHRQRLVENQQTKHFPTDVRALRKRARRHIDAAREELAFFSSLCGGTQTKKTIHDNLRFLEQLNFNVCAVTMLNPAMSGHREPQAGHFFAGIARQPT
jgi:hypothetical protein